MMLKRFLFLLIVAAGLLAGCAAGGGGADIVGREWSLASINGQTPVAGSKVTLSLADGQVSGNTGCNGYGGQVSLKGESISFGDLFHTEMACMEPGIMEQESAFLQTLSQVAGYQVAGERLELKNAGGEVVLVFE